MSALSLTESEGATVRRMAAAVAVAWLGVCIHNRADLPQLPFLSIEYILPTALWGLCLLSWLVRRTLAWPAILLLVWGVVSLVGGFATVLPLPILPFDPPQTLYHYSFHLVYAVAQLPVISLSWREYRRKRPVGRVAA